MTAVCAPLCVAMASLWVWSDVRPTPQIKMVTPTTMHHKEWVVAGGYVTISTLAWLTANPATATASFPGYPYGAEVSGWNALGLHWRDERMTLLRPADRKVVMVLNRTTAFSVWLGVPLLLFAIFPVWWWLRRIAKINREKRKGTCRICGYDLRQTPNRCPECGSVPVPKN